MNNPRPLIPPSYAATPKQRNSAHPSSSSDLAAREHPAPSASRPELFLAWSHVVDAAGAPANSDSVGEHVRASLSVAVPSGTRDFGLWLLRGAFVAGRVNGEAHASQPSTRRSYATAKRAFDIAGSLALLVLLFPALLLIAALIKLDSRGPALFRQRRVGKNGEVFLLWKFRSMRADAPRYAPSPTSDVDPRLTRIGRLIRRISFDELPQLINVLRGEMSLVGPRPEMPFIARGYNALERKRLAVTPGITGLWQVSPARAAPIHENLQYDLHYIQHQNLMLDGAILLRTIAAVIRGVGAV